MGLNSGVSTKPYKRLTEKLTWRTKPKGWMWGEGKRAVTESRAIQQTKREKENKEIDVILKG